MKKAVLFATGIFVYAICVLGKLQIPSPSGSSTTLQVEMSAESLAPSKNCFPKKSTADGRLFPDVDKEESNLLPINPELNH